MNSTKERQRACVNERGRDIKESENVWMNEQILSEVCVCVCLCVSQYTNEMRVCVCWWVGGTPLMLFIYFIISF